VRTDDDAPERVDARDRAAAGADLDHFDDRDAQRQPAAFEKAVDPRHLEGARGLRLRLVDKADLRGRAAHVEGYDLIEPVLTRDAGGKDRAARRTGKRMAVSVAVIPPPEVISRRGQLKPARRSSRSSFAR